MVTGLQLLCCGMFVDLLSSHGLDVVDKMLFCVYQNEAKEDP